ncbi:MAG: DNA-3-methyladenine glycosylase 2 family protein [Alphaproteobacteria bacterium]|nr:DNA-3-methyladenine glycosylase 2 family protein [Alphaproteobacteria bacterium]
MTPEYWDEAKTFLSKKDKVLARIIAGYEGEMMMKKGDAFYTLARAIVGQQISVKAADSVWAKFSKQAGKVTPKNILAASEKDLRACGLSGQKVAYMHSLATHFTQEKAKVKRWPKMDDDELLADITSIKGIGTWTAEMFMIFHLGRSDIFPIKDLGLQKAMFRHYHKSEKVLLGQLSARAEAWRPYRSVATWYLWRSLDPVPVEY